MKRLPITSPTEKSRILAGADRVIRAPSRLSKPARKHFNDIIRENAKAEWTDHSIAIAAQLASAMASLNEQHAILEKEGFVIAGLHGPRSNPRLDAAQKLGATILAYRRSLALAAKDPIAAANRKALAREIEASAEEVGDDLFAKPLQLVHNRG